MSAETGWYADWFGEEYHTVYSHRDLSSARREVQFALSYLEPHKSELILDMACGSGRHLTALRELGYQAVGADLSLFSLSQIKTGEGKEYPLVRYTMEESPFRSGVFDYVLSFFTSFGYFESEQQNQTVLNNIAEWLKPGGKLMLDYLNKPYLLNGLVPNSKRIIDDTEITESRSYDSASGRVVKKIKLVSRAGERNFVESVRVYSKHEISEMLAKSGFELLDCFGDLAGAEYQPESPRLVIFCKSGD